MSLREIDNFVVARERMVRTVRDRGVHSGNVLRALLDVPRHLFVSEALTYSAYEDRALPIGFNQTITRPSTVGRMVQELNLRPGDRVLEIGTGSGYQAAVISRIAGEVVTTERIEELYRRALDILKIRLNYTNVRVVHSGDFSGPRGTFDAIIVAACASAVPEQLLEYLNPHGTMLMPVEHESGQVIRKFRFNGRGEVSIEDAGEVSFVPLVY